MDDLKAIPRRHLPALNDNNRFFWTSGADGVLRFCRCRQCGIYIHPPAPVCPKCWSREVSPQPVSGKGKVVSFTINRQHWEPGLETPYVVALVEMAEQEGLRLTTNIVRIAPAEVKIDLPVRVIFDQREDVWLPLFEPAHGMVEIDK